MCDPILVTLLKIQPHYGKFSRENATPAAHPHYSITCKDPPPPPSAGWYKIINHDCIDKPIW